MYYFLFDYFSAMHILLENLVCLFFQFIVIIDTNANKFDITLGVIDYNIGVGASSGSGSSEYGYVEWAVIIECPGCPEGNFSNAYLEQIPDYILAYNYSNLEQDINGINLSDVVSVNTGLLDYPEIPEITLPFDFDFVDLSFLSVLWSIGITLDTILFIYRWYRTAGTVICGFCFVF